MPNSHGMSAFGDLKYAPDFHHFDYVNVDAPKGGMFSTVPSSRAYNQSFQTFNSLNSFILKGDGAVGMDQTFASLMVRAGDEPDAMYGLVARSVQISKDKLTYRFTLRPEARFHDGTKLTAQDAAFSLNVLKEKGHPIIRQQLRDMVKVEAVNDASLVVVFAEKRGRDVPLYVASLPIFSKAYYDKKPFEESTLDIPLGSGPYTVGRFEVGRYIEYTRVKDWWAKDLAVSRGAFNFDTVRFEFYRDRDVAFEDSRDAIISIVRSLPRASGIRGTIFLRSGMAASNRKYCQTRHRQARKAGSSIHDASNSRIRVSATR